MSRSLRRIHRWTSMVFVVSILVTAIALAQAEPLIWVSYVPLLPLAVLLLTGMYLFAHPYVARRRAPRRS